MKLHTNTAINVISKRGPANDTNPAISNPMKITGRPTINNNAFVIPHVALHAKIINLTDNISIPITNNVIIIYTPLLSL